jgi:TfoX/Sxy family transcriptional regulator of competence genes
VAYDDVLADRLRDRLAGRPAMTEKRMFGGLGFLYHGNMLVGVTGDDLLARLGPGAAEAALAEPGVRPFTMGARTSRGWVVVAGEALDDDALDRWVQRARAFVETLDPK